MWAKYVSVTPGMSSSCLFSLVPVFRGTAAVSTGCGRVVTCSVGTGVEIQWRHESEDRVKGGTSSKLVKAVNGRRYCKHEDMSAV